VNFTHSQEQIEGGEKDSYTISMMVWLAPYDLGASQSIRFVTSHAGGEEEEVYQITLDVHREAGDVASWKRVNRRFLNLIRKQLLIWRTFSADARGEFHERGRQEDESAEMLSDTDLAPQPAD
jgi:hypothetical protein